MAVAKVAEDIDLSTIPIKALKYSTRQELARRLNPEQVLPSSSGLSRDYRGFAERLDFEYIDILNFQRHDNPLMQILDAWEVRKGCTCGALLSILEDIERYDVIEDIKGRIVSDAASYLLKQNQIPLQVAEVTSTPAINFSVHNPDHLTLDDVCCEYGQTHYDAYVCYADEDRQFVRQLSAILESGGIKLFIKDRDALVGTDEYDTYVRLVNERCNRILIILSPEFLRSHECEFQTRYAAGLAIEQAQRKLIPILYRHCDPPPLLKFVAKVDFTKPDIGDWVWQKLLASIKGKPNSAFVTSLMPPCGPPLAASQTSQPIIVFPPTTVMQPVTAATNVSTQQSITAPPASPSVSTSSSAKSTPPSLQRWLHNIIKPRGSTSSSSAASSGFYSQGSRALSSSSCSGENIPTETFL